MDAFLGHADLASLAGDLRTRHVVVAHRPGWKAPITGPLGEVMVDRGTGSVRDLHSSIAGRIYVRAVTQLEIASTDLRALIMSGQDLRYLVPDAVRDLIVAHRVLCCALIVREAEPTRMTTLARPRRAPRRNSALERLVLAALDEMKAVNIKLLDVRGLTDIADAMIVASGTSDRHVRAIAQRVHRKGARSGTPAAGRGGPARRRMGAGGPAGRAAARDAAAGARVLFDRAAVGGAGRGRAAPAAAAPPCTAAGRAAVSARRRDGAARLSCTTAGGRTVHATATDCHRHPHAGLGGRGFKDYWRRMRGPWKLELIELPTASRARGGDAAQAAMAAEAQRILALLAPRDFVVALDERGERAQHARNLSHWLEQQRACRAAHLAFIVGGPDGLAAEVLARGRICVWSLSRLTLPHGLVRVVLAEQIYRAATLLAGHPYHRD